MKKGMTDREKNRRTDGTATSVSLCIAVLCCCTIKWTGQHNVASAECSHSDDFLYNRYWEHAQKLTYFTDSGCEQRIKTADKLSECWAQARIMIPAV